MTDQLVSHLADVIRHYNTLPYGSGGRRHKGMVILQKGNKRTAPETWEEGSTVPEDVADILLSIQFDQKKAVASLFDAAEEVSRHLGLTLSWDEDLKLGSFLLSCLTKSGYYEIRDMYWGSTRIEHGLYACNEEVLEYSLGDWYTRFEPFPEWSGPIDDEGKWLVKPSWPQQKKTFWKPGPECFQGQNKREPSNYTIKWGAMGMEINPSLMDADVEIDTSKIMSVSEILGENPAWIKAVHKLESNAYRISQDLLNVVNEISNNSGPQKINPVLEKEQKDLQLPRRRKRKI